MTPTPGTGLSRSYQYAPEVGGEIEYLDDGTLYSAFKNRSAVGKD